MQSITFDCEVITPLFLAGADGETPELRAPSIKGEIRFWWRALHGHLSLSYMKKQEDVLFGSDGTGKSKIRIRVVPVDMRIKTNLLVPHKSFLKRPSYEVGSRFQVKLGLKDKNQSIFEEASVSNLEQLKILFILTCTLGGFGKRTRRGMGSVKINSPDFPTSLKEVHNLLTKVSRQFKLGYNTILGWDTIYSTFNRNNAYPYLMDIQIGRADVNLLKKISDTTHKLKRKNRYEYEDSMGHVTKRLASPIYVSVIKDRGLMPIITRLNTAPKDIRRQANSNLQDDFIKTIFR